VHSHFTQIDLLTLMMAFGAARRGEQNLIKLARRLMDRLDASVLARAHSYDRLQHSALQAGDVDLLRRLAQFRNDGGLRGGARALSRPAGHGSSSTTTRACTISTARCRMSSTGCR